MQATILLITFVVADYCIDSGAPLFGYSLVLVAMIEVWNSGPIRQYKQRVKDRQIVRDYIARQRARRERWAYVKANYLSWLFQSHEK